MGRILGIRMREWILTLYPVIYNDATEDMFVFIRVDMSFVDGLPLYTFEVDSGWTQVESDGGMVVYAYTDGSECMTVLKIGRAHV